MNLISQFCDYGLAAGWEVAWRATVLLTCVSALMLAMQRASAAIRHLVWSGALVGVLLIPLISMWAPVRISLSSLGAPPVRQLTFFEVRPATETPMPETQLIASAAAEVAALRVLESTQTPRQPVESTVAKFPVRQVVENKWIIRWSVVAVGIWSCGVLALGLPLLLGCFSLHRLRQTSLPVDGRVAEAWSGLVNASPGRRHVVCLLSAVRTMPMTWGVLRPVVLLPVEARQWPLARLRLVLLHELAHIRRCDCLLQMIGQLVRTVHWFNPLVWWSLSQLRLEQERSCDDAVLNLGTHADEYAAELLSVSARLPSFSWDAAVALAMSRVTRLEQRLKAILNMNNNRRPLSRRSVIVSLSVLGSLIFTVASLQWREAQGSPPAQPAALAAPQAAAPPAVSTGRAALPEPTRQAFIDNSAAAAATEKNAAAPAAPAEPAAANNQAGSTDIDAVAKTIESHSLITVAPQVLNEAAIRGMLETLQDPYSGFLSADELKRLHQQIDGHLVGIGVALKQSAATDPITVELLIPNSPAVSGGLKVGDRLLSIDGQPATRLEEAVKSIRGKEGTEVTLKISRGDQQESTLKLKRSQVRLTAVRGISLNERAQWQHWLNSGEKIAYVQLSEFNATAAADLKATLTALNEQGLKGLVLDLRMNPGGSLTSAIEVVQLFLKDATVVQTRERSDEKREFKVGADVAFPNLPLVLLTDRYTASAAEVVAGALQDHERAIVVGERTFGKGSMQSIIPLAKDQGPALKLTTGMMLTPKGRQLSRRPDSKEWGVDPQDGYFIPLTVEQRAARQAKRIAQEKGQLQPKDALTPEMVQQELADPVLAAGLKTLQARLSKGEYEKSGQALQEQDAQFARQDELRKQRDQLKLQMEQLDRELGEVRYRTERR